MGRGARLISAGGPPDPPDPTRRFLEHSFPRFVTVPASEASRIVGELRFFFIYLARNLESKRHFACAHALDGDADDRLAERLADPNCFGVLKSAVMEGLEQGYDVHTVEGLQAWLGQHDHAERAPRRDDRERRKAQRAARRRNR